MLLQLPQMCSPVWQIILSQCYLCSFWCYNIEVGYLQITTCKKENAKTFHNEIKNTEWFSRLYACFDLIN